MSSSLPPFCFSVGSQRVLPVQNMWLLNPSTCGFEMCFAPSTDRCRGSQPKHVSKKSNPFFYFYWVSGLRFDTGLWYWVSGLRFMILVYDTGFQGCGLRRCLWSSGVRLPCPPRSIQTASTASVGVPSASRPTWGSPRMWILMPDRRASCGCVLLVAAGRLCWPRACVRPALSSPGGCRI